MPGEKSLISALGGRLFRTRSAAQGALRLKDLPRGTLLKLRSPIHIDRPFREDGRVFYSLRFPVYTLSGPLNQDSRLDELHCRMDHLFTFNESAMIPAGSIFTVKEARGFVVGEGGEGAADSDYYVAAIRVQHPKYPELFGMGFYSAQGSREPLTIHDFQKLVGNLWDIQLP